MKVVTHPAGNGRTRLEIHPAERFYPNMDYRWPGGWQLLYGYFETFEMFETLSVEDEIREKIVQGAEVEYWKVLERVKIIRIKS